MSLPEPCVHHQATFLEEIAVWGARNEVKHFTRIASLLHKPISVLTAQWPIATIDSKITTKTKYRWLTGSRGDEVLESRTKSGSCNASSAAAPRHYVNRTEG